MNWIARKSSQFLITCIVLVGISALPSLVGQLEFVPSNYWGGLQQQFSQLTKLDEITYFNVTAQRELPLLPAIGPLMKETVIIFMTSLVVAVGFALVYAYFFYRSGTSFIGAEDGFGLYYNKRVKRLRWSRICFGSSSRSSSPLRSIRRQASIASRSREGLPNTYVFYRL